MTEYQRQQYEDARRIFLENVAYMNRTNDEFAEQRGGADSLSDSDRRIYEGRRNRIIRLVGYHDQAQAFIEGLQEWIGELITENRRLSYQVKNPDNSWKRFFPNLIDPHKPDSQREHERRLSILQLQLNHPELF